MFQKLTLIGITALATTSFANTGHAQCGPVPCAAYLAAPYIIQNAPTVMNNAQWYGGSAVRAYQYYQSRPPVQYYSYPPQYRFPQSTPYMAVPQYRRR